MVVLNAPSFKGLYMKPPVENQRQHGVKPTRGVKRGLLPQRRFRSFYFSPDNRKFHAGLHQNSANVRDSGLVFELALEMSARLCCCISPGSSTSVALRFCSPNHWGRPAEPISSFPRSRGGTHTTGSTNQIPEIRERACACGFFCRGSYG